MAPPGSRLARYDALTGGSAGARTLYVVRRELGYGVDEWQALPWWQQQLYIDGLNAEADRADQGAAQTTPGGGSDYIDALYSGTMADVQAQGFGTG